MSIPCKECLCIPVCRHKSYHELVSDCTPAADYVNLTEDEIVNDEDIPEQQMRRIQDLENMLKPTKWTLTGNHE